MDEMDCTPADILHKVYMKYEDRLSTFKPHWSPQLRPTASELAKAGFYYTGQGDTVVCFACKLRLREWEVTDEAMFEHYKWSSDCDFLNMIGYNGQDKLNNQGRDKPSKLGFSNSAAGFLFPPPPPPASSLPHPTVSQTSKGGFQFQPYKPGTQFGVPTTSVPTTASCSFLGKL